MIVENCIKCPDNKGCDYDVCNMRYATATCPDKKCDLLNKNNKLIGLPDYCINKDRTPSRCPLMNKKQFIIKRICLLLGKIFNG
jgi:hypothetical protein